MELNYDIKKYITNELLARVDSRGLIKYLEESGFYEAPASKAHHGNYRGGLFEHSLQVTSNLVRMTACMRLHWERKESPAIVGMLHDLCKVDMYNIMTEEREGEPVEVITYNKNQELIGHGDKSCIIALKYIDLTDEEMMCIRYHMGAFVKEDAEAYSRAAGAFPNVIWTHTADMIAAQVNGV